ncbi:MAG: glycosyltransferase family 2 protein [Coriobacteriaceae bacterium]|jgi:glycosyltransferase involved in cell wall biosynthesis|nr:MAG: glycosyltransferase family 2 protein [Coriobacteriaceae bacterium]
MQPLVSIIVPVYNVRPYLRECIDSLVMQTYENTEIILVDDGSTDGSSALCDELASFSKNIFVRHQSNKGLSGARNTGLAASHGSYLTFVDSDDWLAPDMIERCMNLINAFKADACGVTFNLAYPDGRFIPNETFATEPQCYGTKEALSRYLFNTNLTVCVCGKVWSKELWENVRCPEGKLHEDQHTTYRLIGEAKKVVFDPDPLYFYRQREGSIGHSSFSVRSYDLLDGIDAQYSYTSERYPEVEPRIGAACSFWYCVFVNMMLRSNYWDGSAVAKCQRFVRLHLKAISQTNDLTRKRKAQLWLFALCMPIYKHTYLRFIARRDGR